MFVFNQRSLRAFNEKTLVHYKKHATIMAVFLLVFCDWCFVFFFVARGVFKYLTRLIFIWFSVLFHIF